MACRRSTSNQREELVLKQFSINPVLKHSFLKHVTSHYTLASHNDCEVAFCYVS